MSDTQNTIAIFCLIVIGICFPANVWLAIGRSRLSSKIADMEARLRAWENQSRADTNVQAYNEGAAAERERCAKKLEQLAKGWHAGEPGAALLEGADLIRKGEP